VGIGLSGGYVFKRRYYVGGAFGWHAGYSQGVRVAPAPFETRFSGNVFYVGAEAGYELEVSDFVVRPYLGLGIAGLSASQKDTAGVDIGVEKGSGGAQFLLWPAVVGLYPLSANVLVGADVKLLLMPGGQSAFGLFLTGGGRF
jgi:hypothetical protein